MVERTGAKPKGIRGLIRLQDEPVPTAVSRFQRDLAGAEWNVQQAMVRVDLAEEANGSPTWEDEDLLVVTRMELARLRDYQAEGVVPRRREVVVLGKPVLAITLHAKAQAT